MSDDEAAKLHII